MDDAGGVRLGDRLARVEHVRDHVGHGERAALAQHRREVAAFEMLHDHVRRAVLELSDVVNPRDVLALEPHDRARLADEARHDLRRRVRQQELDRDALAELHVHGRDHHAHPASPDDAFDTVFPGDHVAFLDHRAVALRRAARRLYAGGRRRARDPCVERGAEIARALKAILRFFREAAKDDAIDLRGDGGVERRWRQRLFEEQRAHPGLQRRSPEGPRLREHLVEDEAQREEIGPRIDLLSVRLLGRHVRGRAEDATLLRRAHVEQLFVVGEHDDGLVDELGEAKIKDLDRSIAGDHDVLGLDVAMDDARVVRDGEPDRDVARDAHRLRDSERPRGDPRAQRLSAHELHRDERAALVLARVVDGREARVCDRGRGARLAQKALAPLVRVCAHQHLQRYFAAQRRIVGRVDRAHPSFTKLRLHKEPAYALARGKIRERANARYVRHFA